MISDKLIAKSLLQEAVMRTGLSDKKIARIMKISVPTVNRWRTGKNSPHKLAIPGIIRRLEALTKKNR